MFYIDNDYMTPKHGMQNNYLNCKFDFREKTSLKILNKLVDIDKSLRYLNIPSLLYLLFVRSYK